MRRIAQLDIVALAAGFALGIVMCSSAWGIALVGSMASAFHRVRFGARASTAALGLFAATLIVSIHDARPLEFPTALERGPQDLLLRGVLVDGPRNLGDGAVFEFDVGSVDRRPLHGTVRLYVRDWRGAVAGQHIEVFARCAEFGPADFPGDLGAAARWEAHAVVAGCSAREAPRVLVTRETFANAMRKRLTLRRLRLERGMQTVLRGRAGVPIAMLTGTRGLVTESERRAHQRAGTAHLLAISGLHFGALASIVWFLASLLLARSRAITRTVGARRASSAVVLITMVGYLLIVGAPVSAVRAFVAVSALAVGLMLGRRSAGVAAISAAVVAMLAYSPGLIWDFGFQLSFGATASIVLFWQRLPEALDEQNNPFGRAAWGHRARAMGRFVGMSWAATAATAPLLLGATGELSVIAFVTNLVAVPVVGFVIFPSLLLGALMLEPLPALGEPMVWFATDAMLRMTELLESFGDLPGAVWNPGAPPAWWVFTVCALVFVAISCALRARVLGACFVVAAVLVAGWHWRVTPASWRVHFIPVGQGDATLIQTPDGRNVLVDAGGSQFGRDPGRWVVVPYLRRLGIETLHAVVVTHADTDHAGGVPAVIEALDVVRLIAEPECLEGMRLARWLERGSKNDRSVVTTIDTGASVALFPGDVEQLAERAWLRRSPHRVQVLKVPHHGSKTSSTASFVAATNPLIAVVSAGRHSRFGHPHPSVVERYVKNGTRLFSTPENGLVLVEFGLDGRITVRSRR